MTGEQEPVGSQEAGAEPDEPRPDEDQDEDTDEESQEPDSGSEADLQAV